MTVVVPHGGDAWREPVFAGCHRLNGNGELTGLEWVRESGMLSAPVAITNTHSVGVVRDALVAASVRGPRPDVGVWSLPVVGETYDGLLNDINGFHVTSRARARGARRASGAGRSPRGTSAAGRGWSATSSRAGSGRPRASWPVTSAATPSASSSRRTTASASGCAWTACPVGVRRSRSRRGAQPMGPSRARSTRPSRRPGAGSIIVVVATDAPLLPHQCERLAQRAGLGIARVGGTGGHTSGRPVPRVRDREPAAGRDRAPAVRSSTYDVHAVGDGVIDALFDAAIEATEEAIVNALVAATMTGRDGITAHALPHDRLVETMARFGRPARA